MDSHSPENSKPGSTKQELELSLQEHAALQLLRSNDLRASEALATLDDQSRVRVLAQLSGAAENRAPTDSGSTASVPINETDDGLQGEPEPDTLAQTSVEPRVGSISSASSEQKSKPEAHSARENGGKAEASPVPSATPSLASTKPGPKSMPEESSQGWTGIQSLGRFRGGGRVALDSGSSVDLAHPATRIAARLIDGLIYAVPWVLLTVLSAAWIAWAILFAVFYLYEVTMLANRGQTVGRILMRIRVILEDGSLPTWGAATKRWLIPQAPYALPLALLLPLILVIVTAGPSVEYAGYYGLNASLGAAAILMVLFLVLAFVVAPIGSAIILLSSLFDSSLRGWHDKYAGTLVINVSNDADSRHGEGRA